MRAKQGSRFRAVVFGAAATAIFGMVIGAGPAYAGKAETSSDGGGSTNPEPGATADTTWNPFNPCTVGENETIYQLLACLGTYIDQTWPCRLPHGPGGPELPPGYRPDFPPDLTECPGWDSRGDFRVTYLPPPQIGIEILRRTPDATGSMEPARLRLREDSHNIQVTAVEVNRTHLFAQIHEIEGEPTGGVVEIALNGKVVQAVTTTSGSGIEDINTELLRNIQAAGFTAEYASPYILVTAYHSRSITRVSLRSTDDGLFKSDIGLFPSEGGMTTGTDGTDGEDPADGKDGGDGGDEVDPAGGLTAF